MTAHTPGPWSMQRRDGVPHGDSFNLGWDWNDEPPFNAPPEPMRGLVAKEADARLIAAAPELLAALKDAEAFIAGAVPYYAQDRNEAISERLPQIRAAIAKAEGRSDV